MPLQIDRWPSKPTKWAVFVVSKNETGVITESIRVQIGRVLADNFDMFRCVEALDRDPSALKRWVKKLAAEVLLDWEGLLQHKHDAVCTGKLDCGGCTKVDPTQSVKEDLLLQWNAFRMWLWREALGEEGFMGNMNGVAALPDGGEQRAA